jgi:hypothetical protein
MSDEEEDVATDRKGSGGAKKSAKDKKNPDGVEGKKTKPKSSQVPKEITGKTPQEIAEDEESKRLKKQAHHSGIISKRMDGFKSSLRPSAIIRKHTQNKPVEIFKKAVTRKNKALLLFPGLVAVIKEGKMGQLSNMHKNPILDIEYPNGILKLKGTRVNTKQRFLTLQPKAISFHIYHDDQRQLSMLIV